MEDKNLKLLTIIMRMTQSIKDVLNQDVKNYKLNITEFGVLEYLYHQGPNYTQVISNKLLMPKSSMSYVILTLSKKKYIHIKKEEEDQRKHLISLTSIGHAVIEKAFETHKKKIEKIFDVIDENVKDDLKETLKEIGYHAKDLVSS